MTVDVTALAGGGYVLSRSGYPTGPALLQLYDGDGLLVRDVGPGYNAAAASDGTFVAGGVLGAQWYSQDGDPIGEPVAIVTPDDGLIGYTGALAGMVTTADGALLASWDQYTIGFKGSTTYYPHFGSVGCDGAVLVAPAALPGDSLEGRSQDAPTLHEMPDGRVAAVYSFSARYGRDIEIEFRDGEGDLLGPRVTLDQVRDYPGAYLIDTEVLADGSIGLLLNPNGNNQTDGRIPLVMLRVDEQGAAIGEPVEIFGPPWARGIGEFFANQDGGYTRLWQIWGVGLKYQVYDRDGNALTDQLVAVPFPAGHENYSYAADMLDDGRIAIVVEDYEDPTAPALSTHFLDHAPSHDAQWGGTAATVRTWQEAGLLTREDRIGTLVSHDGVAMKSFIANFVAAGDGDVNANANELANHMVGNEGANVFFSFGANDKLYGLGGDDWLLAGRGDDLIDGGDGNDVAVGGMGDDSIAAGAGADTIAGDEGDDAIDAGDGDDEAHGGAGDDLVSGENGDDSLTGGAGRDWLNGGDGADTLRGDRGDDTLEGGDGPDRFVFATGFGHDTILGFRWTEDEADSDRILVEVDAGSTINGVRVNDAGDVLDLAQDTADGVRIGIGAGHSILLPGWEKLDLAADAFLLVVV